MEKNREKSLQKALPSAGAKGVKVRRSCWELSRASGRSKGPACQDCSLGRERQEPLQPTGGSKGYSPVPHSPCPGPTELGPEASLQSTELGEKEQSRCGRPAGTSGRSLHRVVHIRSTSKTR